MIYLRSFIFNILFFLWSACIAVLAASATLFSQHAICKVARLWGLGTHFLLKVLCGVDFEVRGQEYLNVQPAIIACQHQSVLETTMTQFLVFFNAVVLKRELIWIPLLGQAMYRAGAIPIDRTKGHRAIRQMIQDSRKFIAKKRSIFIFPEGTRSPIDAPIQVKPGVALLYRELNVPVIPIVLNTGHIWGRRKFLKKPGKVIYQFLKPIDPGLSGQEFVQALQSSMTEGYQKLIQS